MLYSALIITSLSLSLLGTVSIDICDNGGKIMPPLSTPYIHSLVFLQHTENHLHVPTLMTTPRGCKQVFMGYFWPIQLDSFILSIAQN